MAMANRMPDPVSTLRALRRRMVPSMRYSVETRVRQGALRRRWVGRSEFSHGGDGT
jgi:hypothetical protein